MQTIFESVTYLVAATVLTYMTFWMRKRAPAGPSRPAGCPRLVPGLN